MPSLVDATEVTTKATALGLTMRPVSEGWPPPAGYAMVLSRTTTCVGPPSLGSSTGSHDKILHSSQEVLYVSPKYTSSVFGAVIAARVRVARVLEVVPHERGVARGARDASRGRREARLSIALNCAMQRRLDDGVRNPS